MWSADDESRTDLYLSLIARTLSKPFSSSSPVLNIPTYSSMVFLRSSRTLKGLSLPSADNFLIFRSISSFLASTTFSVGLTA